MHERARAREASSAAERDGEGCALVPNTSKEVQVWAIMSSSSFMGLVFLTLRSGCRAWLSSTGGRRGRRRRPPPSSLFLLLCLCLPARCFASPTRVSSRRSRKNSLSRFHPFPPHAFSVLLLTLSLSLSSLTPEQKPFLPGTLSCLNRQHQKRQNDVFLVARRG